jgi:hypothetical protein
VTPAGAPSPDLLPAYLRELLADLPRLRRALACPTTPTTPEEEPMPEHRYLDRDEAEREQYARLVNLRPDWTPLQCARVACYWPGLTPRPGHECEPVERRAAALVEEAA